MWSPTGETYVPNRVPLLVLHPVKNSSHMSPVTGARVIANSPSNCSDTSKKSAAVSKRGGGISPRRGADNLTLGGFSPRHEPIITPRSIVFTPDTVQFSSTTPGEKGSPDFCVVYSATPELKTTRESGISNISFDNEPKTATPGIKGILKKNTLTNRVNRYKKNPRKSHFARKVQFEPRTEVIKVESYKEIYMQEDDEVEQPAKRALTGGGEPYVGPCPQCNIL